MDFENLDRHWKRLFAFPEETLRDPAISKDGTLHDGAKLFKKFTVSACEIILDDLHQSRGVPGPEYYADALRHGLGVFRKIGHVPSPIGGERQRASQVDNSLSGDGERACVCGTCIGHMSRSRANDLTADTWSPWEWVTPCGSDSYSFRSVNYFSDTSSIVEEVQQIPKEQNVNEGETSKSFRAIRRGEPKSLGESGGERRDSSTDSDHECDLEQRAKEDHDKHSFTQVALTKSGATQQFEKDSEYLPYGPLGAVKTSNRFHRLEPTRKNSPKKKKKKSNRLPYKPAVEQNRDAEKRECIIC